MSVLPIIDEMLILSVITAQKALSPQTSRGGKSPAQKPALLLLSQSRLIFTLSILGGQDALCRTRSVTEITAKVPQWDSKNIAVPCAVQPSHSS